MSLVVLARSNELVCCGGGENHHFDARLSMCLHIAVGWVWWLAPAAARTSPGRARARASWQRSSRLYIRWIQAYLHLYCHIFRFLS